VPVIVLKAGIAENTGILVME
jgi:hypothetical protein